MREQSRRVRETPEEKVRQDLICRMIGSLGYPRSLISVEKAISSLIRVGREEDPLRRIDILCFMPKSDGLSPLLLVECKASESALDQAEAQVLGYNEKIKAPFIALASPMGVKTLWQEGKKMASIPFLPSFAQLVEKVSFFGIS